MTREEEIKQAAESHALQLCNLCLDKYCLQMGLTCPNIRESVIAFTDGSEWADKHPNLASLWHDASEEPKGGNWKILYVDVFNECWVESKFNAVLLHNKQGEYKWDEYVATELVKMWAYIDDILPKGGKQ